jgi:hypothetical protein
MDTGTPATYTDPNLNTYSGFIIGHDFTMRNVWRAVSPGPGVLGAIRFKVDGTVADGPAAQSDTVAIEKVETHLFNFIGWFRDGTPKLFVLAPTDLHVDPAVTATPTFHPSPSDV